MAGGLLVALALWILVSGADDLFIAIARLFACRREVDRPSDAQVQAAPRRRIAILVACWREHRVIGQMLDRTVSALSYPDYEIFVGVYPNDRPTVEAVSEAEQRHSRVHMAVLPHDGPSSKGDCLNWTFERLRTYESQEGVRFDIIVTHDAEDVVHPESLGLINWYSRDYQMVQIPVLALPTKVREWTHGLYCDEFAEFQSKDIPVRVRLGGFLPSNGVGCGFRRDALEALAAARQGRIFDPGCLTEDYENGFRLHQMRYRQIFVPVRIRNGTPVATREYFPLTARAAIRQRSRWIAGISLQGWQFHGWRVPWRQRYWFFRDRKGLVGSFLSPAANLASIALLARNVFHLPAAPPLFWQLYYGTLAMAAAQTAQRVYFSSRIYGLWFGIFAPIRTIWGNAINCAATCIAIPQFTASLRSGRKLAWRKTDHDYPLQQSGQTRQRLGDVLLRMRLVTERDLAAAVAEPRALRLGERLIELRKLTEDDLYRALGAQAGLPCGAPPPEDVTPDAPRAMPGGVVRRWKVLPFRIALGQIHIATTEIPTDEMAQELSGISTLDVRFRLVSPREYRELAILTGTEEDCIRS